MNVILNEVKRLSQKYNKKEKVIERMLENYIRMGYNEKEFENDINTFYNITKKCDYPKITQTRRYKHTRKTCFKDLNL